MLCKFFRSEVLGGVVSVYSSAETGMCKSGQLQYGYFITRVVICSPPPSKILNIKTVTTDRKIPALHRSRPRLTQYWLGDHPVDSTVSSWTVLPVSVVGYDHQQHTERHSE